MKRSILGEELVGYVCPESGGCYIPANCYWKWLSERKERLPRSPLESGRLAAEEGFRPARICPETGTIMTRYEVGHGYRFSIDRSITGGIWLDAGEWEALRQRNFHDELHLVFTAEWQKQIVTEQARAAYEALLRAKLGDELFESMSRIKSTIEDSPHRALAIAFISAID